MASFASLSRFTLASCLVGLLGASAVGAGCGGSVADSPAGDAGNDAPVHPDPGPTDAGPTHVPLAPRCTEKRPPDPVTPIDAGVPTLPDGGPGFFAKHPLPQLQNNGGPTLQNPRLVPIFFQGDDMADDLEDFVASMGCTDYWRQAVSEYGIGDAIAAPSVRLTEKAPTNITDSQIESWLSKKITMASSPLEAPTKDTLYLIFYPDTTTITEQGGQSCQAFGGYHTDITVSGKHVAYAVIPRCDGFAGLPANDATTGSTSHEIIEAATDPYNKEDPAYAFTDTDHLAWVFVLGGESGDLCAQEPDAFYQPDSYPFTVQRNWSNLQAQAGLYPCRPSASRPYFTAAVALPDAVSLFGTPARGVNVPVGSSKTIDVDLYSEKPGTTIQVQAFDASQQLGTKGSSHYSLDQSSGVSGDTLHLTITTPQGSPTDPEIFALYVRQNGEARIGWVGAVGH